MADVPRGFVAAFGVIDIRPAAAADIGDLVALGAKLFEEDAARHDSFIDLTWSVREGHEDFRTLLADPRALVLVATAAEEPIGHLVGYLADASPTREPVTFAVLRSMYLDQDHRRQGVGRRFVAEFVEWARTSGCVEVHVSSYVANEAAGRFYAAAGFEPRSVSQVLSL